MGPMLKLNLRATLRTGRATCGRCRRDGLSAYRPRPLGPGHVVPAGLHPAVLESAKTGSLPTAKAGLLPGVRTEFCFSVLVCLREFEGLVGLRGVQVPRRYVRSKWVRGCGAISCLGFRDRSLYIAVQVVI